MADEQTAQVAAEQEAAAPQEAAPVQPEFVEVKVADLSGYDEAIAAQEKLLGLVSESELTSVETELSRLKEARAKAESSSTMQKLQYYEELHFKDKVANEFPGIDVDKLPGNTPEQRYNAAKAAWDALSPMRERVSELEKKLATDEPTPEQVAAHGEPIQPSGQPITEDELAKMSEAVDGGKLEDVLKNPAMKRKLENIMGNTFE